MTPRNPATLLACLLILALPGCASVAAPLLKPHVTTNPEKLASGEWKLDQKHASLTFKIGHLGYSNYVGRFEGFDVLLDGDPEAPGEAQVSATIDMTTLDVANDPFAETLMGDGWFEADKFPEAVFNSTAVRQTGPDTADVDGLLTLHGKQAPVTLSVTFNGGAYDRLRGKDVIGFSATTTISRSAFGITQFEGLLDDDVPIEIEAELIKADSAS